MTMYEKLPETLFNIICSSKQFRKQEIEATTEGLVNMFKQYKSVYPEDSETYQDLVSELGEIYRNALTYSDKGDYLNLWNAATEFKKISGEISNLLFRNSKRNFDSASEKMYNNLVEELNENGFGLQKENWGDGHV